MLHRPMGTERQAVLVTGSSSGIGAAIVRAFAAEGACVAVTSTARSHAAGEALAREVGGVYLEADLGDPAAASDLVERAVEQLGGLDVLINNAATTAVIPHDDLDAADAEVWRRILDVNVIGTWQVTRAAVPHLRRSGAGQVITITSTSATRPTGSSIPYAVSKAALNHLTALLAKALGPEVRVNAIAPGLIETPWSADWGEAHEYVRREAALRRSGAPEDIAHACLLLSKTPYATGTVMTVDGGLSLL
jgi:ketoreductase RED2